MPPLDYRPDATKLRLMSAHAKLWPNRSWSRERLVMTRPSSSSMSLITNLLLKTASGPAATGK